MDAFVDLCMYVCMRNDVLSKTGGISVFAREWVIAGLLTMR
jgi:hypothetical protein